MSAQLLGAIASAATTVILLALFRMIGKMRKDMHRFMTEHLWLLASAQWTHRTVAQIMKELGINGDPPPEWPGKR